MCCYEWVSLRPFDDVRGGQAVFRVLSGSKEEEKIFREREREREREEEKGRESIAR